MNRFRVSGPYLEGQGDLVSRLVNPITSTVTLAIPMIDLLAKPPSPLPSSYMLLRAYA